MIRKREFSGLMLFCVLVLASNIRLTRTLHPPPTEWTRTYGINGNHSEARSLVQTNDGGYAVLGFTQHHLTGWVYTEDFWLVKTDPAGNVEWNKTYGAPTGAHLESGQSVVQTDDEGYALTGHISTEGNPPTDYDIWLIKTDSLGGMEWNRTFGGADIDTANSVIQTSDTGYIMAGFTYSYGAGKTDVYLVKTDSAGNMVWNQTYGGADHDWANSVVQTSDGGYVMAGVTESYGAGNRDGWLIKTDSAGHMMWNRTYGGLDGDYASSVVSASDGEYVVAGSTHSFGAGDYDFWLVKTDSAGSIVWNQAYGGTQTEEAHSMVQTTDGGYALVGWARSSVPGGYDYWLVKTNSTGHMMWNRTYGGPLNDRAYDVVQTVDGGYALAGFSNYYINSSYAVVDFWLIKTGSGGDVNGDGMVDIFDLSIAAVAYGSFEGEPEYNPEADLNEDGLVDIRDIAIVALNFGIG